MAQSFSAQVDEWVAMCHRRMEAVLKQSAQDVFNEAQRVGPNYRDPSAGEGGHMPVVTGQLRASLTMERNGGGSLAGPSSYVFTIASLEVGDVLTGVWTAEYARKVHYGTAAKPGRMWVPFAARQWQDIVARNAAKARMMP